MSKEYIILGNNVDCNYTQQGLLNKHDKLELVKFRERNITCKMKH